MANSSSNSNSQTSDPREVQAGAELLQTVLDDDRYPWPSELKTAEQEAEADEAAGQLLEISDEEANLGWQGLSAQLDQIWGETGSASVLERLQQKFANRLPANLLNQIADKAQQVVSSGEPKVAQMIACVQDGLANMAAADLQVMARPMAMAMRGGSEEEFVEATIQTIRTDEWENLSPIEQAKLGLAAARYAIAQVENEAS